MCPHRRQYRRTIIRRNTPSTGSAFAYLPCWYRLWLTRQVADAPCDHTSLLRSLTEKWDLGPMGARTAQTTDVFAQLQRATALRTDTPKKIGMDLPGESAAPEPNTDHQNAVLQLAEQLDPTPGLTPRQRTDNFLARGGPPSVESPQWTSSKDRRRPCPSPRSGILRDPGHDARTSPREPVGRVSLCTELPAGTPDAERGKP
jgi:hypothetical protein